MIEVVELLAGVGGFRLGLERQGDFNIVWGNEWDPSNKVQYAFNCYSSNFIGNGIHSNEDISKAKYNIPNHDLLVGGFLCQDYSVSSSTSQYSEGQRKKGVLFWDIIDIVIMKKPKYVLLENVYTLLKSPQKQQGRDFAILLASFRDAGYYVEWRVINAADYGFAQKRNRVFIFATREDTKYAEKLMALSSHDIILKDGFFVSEFQIEGFSELCPAFGETLPLDIVDISYNYSAKFRNVGIMKKGEFYTVEVIPKSVPFKTLGEVINEAKIYQVDMEKYYLSEEKILKNGMTTLEMFEYLKGPKKIERVSNSGHLYTYSEGGLSFPDSLTIPSRTILTSEGTLHRSSHVVRDPDTNRLRILTPVECELLNDFPPNWTFCIPEKARYYCMGNALVVGLIEKMGKKIKEIYKGEHLSHLLEDIEVESGSNDLNSDITKFYVPFQKKGKNSQSKTNKMLNIEFCKAIPRKDLYFQKKERQILLYTTAIGEKIFIQYPGKESVNNKKPWDFRPKLLKPDGDYLNDLSFEVIWDVLYESFLNISNRDKLLRLLALEFYRMAFVIDYKILDHNHIYEARDYDFSNDTYSSFYNINIGKKLFLYIPNQIIVKELSLVKPKILGISWEAFLVYNDLLAFNEDCKYFYTEESKNGDGATYIAGGPGRTNTLLTHINIIGSIIGEIKFSKILLQFSRNRGIAPITQNHLRTILGDYLY